MTDPDQSKIRAVIAPAPLRRALAYMVTVALGGLFIYLGLLRPVSPLWTVAVIALGGLLLWLAELLRRATALSLELTDDEVRDSAGRTLARLDDIVLVNRGTFSLKPSNGFSLILRSPGPTTWAPGLWWRIGRRVGVGGVVPASQAKFMAEAIAAHLPPQP